MRWLSPELREKSSISSELGRQREGEGAGPELRDPSGEEGSGPETVLQEQRPPWIPVLMRCWAPHNSDTQKALSLGSSQPWRSLCGAEQPQGLSWEKCPPSLPTAMAPAAQPTLPRTPGASFLSTGGPRWDHPASSHYSQPPVMPQDRGPDSAPHCEIQASFHLRPHKRAPQGDSGSIRGTMCWLSYWVSSPGLQPHPALPAGTKDMAHFQVPSQSPHTA